MSSDLAITVNKKSQAELQAWLNMFPVAMQDALMKRALRQYARDAMAVMKAQTPNRYPDAKNSIRYKMKLWPSDIIWVGIGYRTIPGQSAGRFAFGRQRRAIYDEEGVGWRTHFMELGFHTWSSALRKPPTARGLGWKRGLYHRGRGSYKRGKFVSQIAAQATSGKVVPYMIRELDFATRQALARSKREMRKVRRRNVLSFTAQV